MEKNKIDTRDDALIIAGMRFKSLNACAHRMIGIARLFQRHCFNVFLLGVSEEKDEGVYDNFEYSTLIYPNSFRKWIKFTFSAKEYLKEIKLHKNVKYVVINGSVPSIPTIKIAKYCKKHNISFIFDIGEWYTTNGAGFIKKIIKSFDTFLKMHYVCKKYCNYIVSSSFLANYCGSQKNVFTLPTIVTTKLDNSKKRLPTKLENIVRLSFIGIPEKNNAKENLDPFIDAIDSFNKTHSTKFVLNIIGCDGVDSDYVHYKGKRPYNECVEFLIDSDFTVIPRGKTRKNQSGFPTKLSESFLYDVPVISTDTSDIGKYLFDEINGFLIAKNEKESYVHCFEKIENKITENKKYLDELSFNVIKNNKLKLDNFVDVFDLFFTKIVP